MKHWRDYLDRRALVVQKNGDGGDSLNRTCAHAILSLLTEDAPSTSVAFLFQLRCGRGVYARNPQHTGMWYTKPNTTSRDQLIPLVILLGLNGGLGAYLWDLFVDHLKRGLLFARNTRRNFQYPTLEEHLAKSTPDVKWNYRWKVPDLTGPEFWALYVRGFSKWYTYPLLYFFDLETLISSVVIRCKSKKDDVINHALVLEYGKVRMDTFVMKLARLITPRALLQKRLDIFFGKEQEPPINELYSRLR